MPGLIGVAALIGAVRGMGVKVQNIVLDKPEEPIPPGKKAFVEKVKIWWKTGNSNLGKKEDPCHKQKK